MADGKSFKDQISPFVWVEDKESASVVLGANRYLQDVFDAQDFEGSGYDWEGLARVFLDEKRSDLSERFILILKQGCFVFLLRIPRHCRILFALLKMPVRIDLLFRTC